MIGELFGGRFLIKDELGRGGMGTVYRAEQTALGRMVALKIMHGYLAQAPGAAARFHREARVLAKLKHPRSVEVYDLGEVDTNLFIAMEMLHGVGLDEVLRQGPLAAARAVDITAQVLEALEAAHELGIVHRDLKPANIFLMAPVANEPAGDRVKVLDFGLATLKEEEGGRITRQGQTAGTPAYMSPEQCRGEKVDGRADIYALGCTMYEMLTGAPPFGYGDDNPMEVMAAQLFQPPPKPTVERWDLGIPEPVEAALLKSLAKLPKERYANAAEMRAALIDSLSAKEEEARGAGKKLGRPESVQAAPAITAGAGKVVGIFGAGANARALQTALGAAGIDIRDLPQGGELTGLSLIVVAPPEGGSGLDEASKLVAQKGAPPVLLCGAEDDLPQMAKAISAGVFDYVPLPLDPVDLSKKVSRALRKR